MQSLFRYALFAAIAEADTLSLAARRLNISKSSASKQLHALEEELGTRLIKRSTRRMTLTAEGHALYRQCAPLLTQYQQIADCAEGLSNTAAGSLRVSVPQVFGQHRISPLLPEFLSLYPEVSITMHLEQQRLSDLDWAIDLALVFGKLEDSSLIAKKLLDNHFVLCAAPSYIAEHGSPETPQDLHHHNCLLIDYPNIDNIPRWELSRGNESEVVEVTGNLRVNDSSAILHAARSGMGIASIPTYLVQEDLQQGQLVEVVSEFHLKSVPLYAVFHDRDLRPLKLTRFLEFLEQRLSM